MRIKNLTQLLAVSAFVLLGVSCTNDNNTDKGDGEQGGGTTTLAQSEVRQKIATYYSAPSSPAQAVAAITQAFNTQFPTATDVEWKVSGGIYEIEFEVNRIDNEVYYDAEANLLMHIEDVAVNTLPAAVTAAIATDYPDYITDDAKKVVKGNITGYFVDLEKNRSEVHAFYNEDGTFIAKNLWEDDSTKPANDATTETPPVSGSTTAEQADALIEAFYAVHDTDVLPSNVPAAIMQNFNTLFSAARDIDWEMSADVYNSDFEINNVDYDAWFTADGSMLAYKFDVTRSSVPQAVQNTINSLYSGYTIDDVEKVVKTGSIGYQVELENRNTEEDAFILEDGTYVSTVFYKSNSNPGTPPTDPVTPEIPVSDNYTDEEIDQLLLAYERGRDTDVYPSALPAALSAAFAKQFGNAYDTDWERVDNIYKVEFEIGNTDYEAWYVENGVLLMFTQEVRYNSIPDAVQSAVASDYSGYMIDGCEYFQKGTIKGYIIEIENNRTDAELTVLYDVDGTFLYQQRD